MLDIKFIRENKDIVLKAIKDKKAAPVDIDRILALYDERKKILSVVEGKRAEQNIFSEKIAREADSAKRDQMITEMKPLKEELQGEEDKLKPIMAEFTELMIKIPNIPSPDTPIGEDESKNKVLRTWGTPPKFAFKPKDHTELGAKLDLIDNERAGKVSGARFAYIKGDLALLQFAIVKFVFDTLTNSGTLQKIIEKSNVGVSPKPFVPVLPPVFIKPVPFQAMARLEPKEERYYMEKDDLYLIGSAEHTLGAMHMDEVLNEKELPIRYIGYSTSFRREAGSYGKDTKGIIRVHQFDKVEMESFTLPELSYKEQDFLVAIQEYLMQELKLPYQVVIVCTGDMGGPDHRQIDIETWMPGQDKYRETHSADLMGGFQARRLNTRVRRADGVSEPVHMNDATAFALGRTMVAIIENYQQDDGTISIPEALQSYTGGRKFIGK